MREDSLLLRLKRLIRWLPVFLTRDIWRAHTFRYTGFKGGIFGLLRLFSVLCSGTRRNRATTQAAALGYYTLIGLGPMVVLVIMVSSFVFKGSDQNLAVVSLHKVISFIAPSVDEYSRVEVAAHGESKTAANVVEDSGKISSEDFNPQLIQLIDKLVMSAQSGTVGIVGLLMLIFICLQLIVLVEKTFNAIWGIQQGRSLMQRIVLYWTLLTLGAILGFTSITFFSATAFNEFFNKIPFGLELLRTFPWLGKAMGYALLVLLLTLFYRFIPNTTVKWIPSMVGGSLVALLLWGNNYLSFLYIKRVVSTQSLYGSVGIVFVMMLGLFIFWLFILVGGQITYAVQNTLSLAHQRAWDNASVRTREMLSLVTFAKIAQRFIACEQPYSLAELSQQINAPGQILNRSLNWLNELGWVSVVEGTGESGDRVLRYQPGRPLQAITLADFKDAFESYGNNAGVDLIHAGNDELIRDYETYILDYTHCPETTRDFQTIFARNGVKD